MAISKMKRKLSKRILRNILACYHRASDTDRREGLYWYETAHNDAVALAERYGISVYQSAGVISALSPTNGWGSNLLDADILISAWRAGKRLPIVGVYGFNNVAKAGSILNGASDGLSVLSQFNQKTGPKTWAFYQLIAEPLNSDLVCVDRHAKAIALNCLASDIDGSATVRRSEYAYIARHYVEIARLVELLPHQVQAITWITWRRLSGNLEQIDLPF